MKGFKWQALIYILERRNILADLWGADSTYQIKRGTLGAQSGALWWPRGGGWEEGREAQEGDIYIYILTLMADSRCCMKETNTTLQSDFPPIKK